MSILRIPPRLALGPALAYLLLPTIAQAEDKFDFTTTWYQEKRRGNLGGLTVVHPQLDLGVDVGEHLTIDIGYASDVVSGATAAVYAVDAVTSATTFSDVRHDGSFGITILGARSDLSISSNVAVERDYTSISVSAAGNISLPGKNTILGLSYSHSFDAVCDFDNGMATALERSPLTAQQTCKKDKGILGVDIAADSVWRDLSIDTAQATLTQNISPSVVAQFGLFGQVLRGFQANPYRRVRVSGVEAQEALPDVRSRVALMARVNKYMPSLHSALHLMLRGYSDTWGVNSLTAGLGYSQYFGPSLLLRFNTRIYQQGEATFFKDAFFYEIEGSAGEFFTGDRELGSVRNIVTGAKLSYIKFDESGEPVWGVFDKIDFNLKADIYMLDELPSDPIEENREGIDRQFLSSGQTLDAFVLQLGILFRY
ncbi:MAG: DUF3570 domain-containing protein [Kofleriaceae bacterium]|nr:DUF3570 domain-containing protein [Kofleriaceae bacterium]